jgi:hypothetical protein
MYSKRGWPGVVLAFIAITAVKSPIIFFILVLTVVAGGVVAVVIKLTRRQDPVQVLLLNDHADQRVRPSR